MNIEEIKQLVQLMIENDLSELNVADGETKVFLKRGPSGLPVVVAAPPATNEPSASGRSGGAAPSAATRAEQAPEELIDIKSPMVGTFYAAAGPDSDPYVAVGTAVSEDSVVCIIEAMKVMNEIKAECSGTVQEICVKNAQPVEYGQVLFRVKPA